MSVTRIRTGLLAGSVVALGAAALIAATPSDAPIADAAQRGDVQAVRSLLRQGEDPNAAQADGMTALHWAALNGEIEIAEVLLYAGATAKAGTRLGNYTPLHLASRGGHAAVARAVLEAGADADAVTTTGVTPLHFAAQADAAEVIRALVEHGANVDATDSFSSRTPLMFASARNATRAVEALITSVADLSLTTDVKDYNQIAEETNADRQRRNRIRDAAEEPDPDAEETRGRGGRGGPPGGRGAAAGRGRGGQAQPDPATPDPAADPATPDPAADPATPDPAAELADSVETIPAEPAEPPPPPPVTALSSTEQIGTQGGFTALHYAAREGHREAARLLVEAGGDVDQVTAGDESSPLLVAVINGNYDLARDLLEAGADPNLLSDDGAGPLFATLNIEWSLRTWYPQPAMFRQQETTHLELMELLLEAGADPNQRTSTHIWYAAYNAGRMGVDFTGATPFWRAAYATDLNAMRLLVAFGADPDIWTTKLPRRRRFVRDPDIPTNPTNDEPDPEDPSGLPPVPIGGPGIHPLHAASGVGFGTSRVAQQHRSVPDGWLPAVRYLVEELGIDPNLRDMDGYTPLHHAAARGDNETILYLVSRGADITVISRRGQTTADLANSPEQRAQPHPATVVLLEKLGSLNNHQCRTCGAGR